MSDEGIEIRLRAWANVVPPVAHAVIPGITNERLREIATAGCLCTDCEPEIGNLARLMAEELLMFRATIEPAHQDSARPMSGETPT